MPLDWALTPAGEETDDPAAAMTGALLGIGGHKGYGLAFMTEALTGVLSGGGFGITALFGPGEDGCLAQLYRHRHFLVHACRRL